MKQKKKSRFWTFCFSFIPGAAEMYMGFMKMGLSLMSIFIVIVFVTAILNIGPLVFIAALAWFYSFFHARNIAKMDQFEFDEMKDEYLFELNQVKTEEIKSVIANQKAIAYVLIGIGVYLVWKSFFRVIYWIAPVRFQNLFWSMEDIFTRLVLGVIIVFAGLYLIRGKKRELFYETSQTDTKKQETEKQATMQQDAVQQDSERSEEENVYLIEEGQKDGGNEERENA